MYVFTGLQAYKDMLEYKCTIAQAIQWGLIVYQDKWRPVHSLRIGSITINMEVPF